MVELQRWRDKRGLKFHLQPKYSPFNARLADGVLIAAIEAGHDPDPFLRRAFPAVWEDQLDLADAMIEARLVNAAGLPAKELVERSGTAAIDEAYEQNRQDAIAPMYSARRPMCWTARCFGARTASNCWQMH